MARFNDCLQVILGNEGGTSNNAADHGGLTRCGVTQATYDQYRTARKLPQQPVTLITQAEINDIYNIYYWVPAHCDQLPQPVDLCVFDTAVNSGVGRSSKLLQAAVGVTQDGAVGPATLAAVSAIDPVACATQFCDQREAFYRGIVAHDPTQGVFLAGWLNRLNHIRNLAGIPGY